MSASFASISSSASSQLIGLKPVRYALLGLVRRIGVRMRFGL
jgi:hypothetical protein